MGDNRPASETPFQWRFAGGLIVARDNMLAGYMRCVKFTTSAAAKQSVSLPFCVIFLAYKVSYYFPIQTKFDIARILTRILTNAQATLIYLKDERLKAPQNVYRNNCLTSVMLHL